MNHQPHTTRYPRDDSYTWHRAALAPLLSHSSSNVPGATDEAFVEFLLNQGLGPLWDHAINEQNFNPRLSPQSEERLHNNRLHATAHYLVQRNSLLAIKPILEVAEVPHLVFKGCHTRELLFSEPSLRPAQDIDVLIPNEQKTQAIRAFVDAGFKFHGTPDNISHECSLTQGNTSIDLHWDIFRPGRTRIPMAPKILDTRKDCGSHWGPDENSTLFLLLVHPVFTKYLTTPHASLVRQLDLVYLLTKEEVDWAKVLNWLSVAGMKTAAWLSLTWLEMLTDIAAPKEVMAKLEPGVVKQTYLTYWLRHNLSSRLLNSPSLVQLGFTLPAHDSWKDALAASRKAAACRRAGSVTLKVIGGQGPVMS